MLAVCIARARMVRFRSFDEWICIRASGLESGTLGRYIEWFRLFWRNDGNRF